MVGGRSILSGCRHGLLEHGGRTERIMKLLNDAPMGAATHACDVELGIGCAVDAVSGEAELLGDRCGIRLA